MTFRKTDVLSSELSGEVGDRYLPYHILQITFLKLERRPNAEPKAEQHTVFYFLHSNTFFLFFPLKTEETAILEQIYL